MLLSPKYTLNTGGHAPTYLERKPTGWSRFYHSDYLLAFPPLGAYPVFSNLKISLGWLDTHKRETSVVDITYDPNKTTINSAALIVSASCDMAWGFSSRMRIYVNGGPVAEKIFYGPESFSGRLDITIQRGDNIFDVDFDKYMLINFGAELTVTATLNVEYSGEEPGVGSPRTPLPDWWPYAAAGIGMAVIGGVILMKKK